MSKFTKTKIVATLGPASHTKKIITQLIQAGVNVFRVNFSHGSHANHAKTIQTIHKVKNELNVNVSVLADLQGPKIRLGQDVENDGVQIQSGDTVILTTDVITSTAKKLYVTYEPLAKDVAIDDKILIDDGKIELKVLSSNNKNEVTCQVTFGGLVKPRKGVNLPDTSISMPSLTPKDLNDLQFILTQNVNWIALSFVRTAKDITELKAMIADKQHPAKVIAKIEKPEALKNIDAIIEATDAVMVARGDLGVEVPLEEIPLTQKNIVRKCVMAAKPVIIATQMMESMIENSSPTRAEITDVANAIFDGADAVMLSGETAMGAHPVKVIETMKRIIAKAEEDESIYQQKGKPKPALNPLFLSDAVCYNACRMAKTISAKAILGMTMSGYTAFVLSSFRPKANIYVFTSDAQLLNQLSLLWGVRAYLYHGSESIDTVIDDVQNALQAEGLIKTGDVVINTGSIPLAEKGRTNIIKVSVIE